jgi:hypothetical protein
MIPHAVVKHLQACPGIAPSMELVSQQSWWHPRTVVDHGYYYTIAQQSNK